jgi:hypothetical protein
MGSGGRLKPRKPTLEEIDQSRLQIFRPSMFGGTLAEILGTALSHIMELYLLNIFLSFS